MFFFNPTRFHFCGCVKQSLRWRRSSNSYRGYASDYQFISPKQGVSIFSYPYLEVSTFRVPLRVKPVDPSLRGTQTSLLLLGSSCSVSLLLLLEVAFLRTEHERGQLSNVARQVTCCVPQLFLVASLSIHSWVWWKKSTRTGNYYIYLYNYVYIYIYIYLFTDYIYT